MTLSTHTVQLLACTLGLAAAPVSAALTFDVRGVIPAEFVGQTPYFIFEFTSSAFPDRNNSSQAKLTNLAQNGAAQPVAGSEGRFGGASGSLFSGEIKSVLLRDNDPQSGSQYGFSLQTGNAFDFRVELSGPEWDGRTRPSSGDFALYVRTDALGTPLFDSGGPFFSAVDITLDGDGTPVIDASDVFTVSAVPEPATLALLGVGGLGMLRRRRA